MVLVVADNGSGLALDVGMAFGSILAVLVDDVLDAERFEGCLVEGDRPFKIRDGDEDVVEHSDLLV